MRKFQYLLSMLKRSWICYYIICMTVLSVTRIYRFHIKFNFDIYLQMNE